MNGSATHNAKEENMIVNKLKLPNKNTLIWLGNQPIYGCENILVLAGGDVLFLKPIKSFKVRDIQRDMEQLSREKFFKKYEWPYDSSGNDLYRELRKTEEYPASPSPDEPKA
jgi:hypothetical protein